MRKRGRRFFATVSGDFGRALAAVWLCRHFIRKHKRFPSSTQDMYEQRIDAIARKLASSRYKNNPWEAGPFVLWNMRYALEEDRDATLSNLIWETFLADDEYSELFALGLRPVPGNPSVWMRPPNDK